MILKFKTQAQATDYLAKNGYKVAASTFGLHYRQGKIPRGEDGLFSGEALLGYAKVHLASTEQIEDEKAKGAAVAKTSADANLKSVRARREQLRLDKELGRYMLREDFEQEMARRARFFKSEIQSFILRKASEIIRVTQGKADSRAALTAWWKEETADWMDAWSRDRVFAEPEEGEENVRPD